MQNKHLNPIATNLILGSELHLMNPTSPSRHSPEFWIEHLGLLPHPEGGYYKETYRSVEEIPPQGLGTKFNGSRNVATAIYFMLTGRDRSLFHRIKSDELWHFHEGCALAIYVLTNGGMVTLKLGPNPLNSESLQIAVPANHWFGALPLETDSYTLASCTVSPGFDFQDFEIAEREKLLAEFPNAREIINTLTK